jgi:hypothetical protein
MVTVILPVVLYRCETLSPLNHIPVGLRPRCGYLSRELGRMFGLDIEHKTRVQNCVSLWRSVMRCGGMQHEWE